VGLDVYMKSVGLDTNDIQKLDSHNIMTQCDLTKIQKTNSKICAEEEKCVYQWLW